MKYFSALVCCIGLFTTINATTILQTLYINRGLFTTVQSTTFPALAFNETMSFDALNKVITIGVNDTLIVTVINNDTTVHGFAVKNYPAINGTINPAGTYTDTLVSSAERIYVYYDNYNYPDYRYLGAAGMICVSNSAANNFYWNIQEHQTSFNDSLAVGAGVNWNNYYPDYFTINGKSFPDLQNDSTAVVNGQVGDTIRIFIVNTGQALHSIHFHGFHCRVIQSTSTNMQTGESKDTFPMKSMEGVILEMVPDKVGQYSVHDHNLAAVTGGNTHPNGMFIIMNIQ
jgi:hypothetical protein